MILRVLPPAVLAAVPAAVLWGGATAAQPSFDCATASRPVERAICASPPLAALDRELDAAYGRAFDRLDTEGRAALRDGQRMWLKLRDACGGSEPCIAGLYRARIARIERDFAGTGEAPRAPAAAAPPRPAIPTPSTTPRVPAAAAPVSLPARGRSLGGFARTEPNRSATPIAVLHRDEDVTVEEAAGVPGPDGFDWFRIRYAGGRGYAWGGEICVPDGGLAGTQGPCPR